MTIIQRIRAVATLIIAPFLTLVISIAAWIDLSYISRSRENALKFPRIWGRTLCRLAGVKVVIEGIENIAPDQTYILVGNHCSQFDIFSFQGYFPYNFRWIAKKELFNIPVFGPAMHKAGFIAIDRSHGRKALKSLDDAAKQIADGASVLIFPEGTRSADGTLSEFKTGAVLLAIKSGVPVVPIGFNGSYEVLPKGRVLADKGTITIRVGSPMAIDRYNKKDKQQVSLAMKSAVEDLLDPAYKTVDTAN